MSHVAQVDVKFTNVEAIRAACSRMDARYCGKGFITFYDDTEIGGLVVQLPQWEYAVVIKADGSLYYDNYGGDWGDIKYLNRFKQLYAVENAKLAAQEKGYSFEEEELSTGVLKVTINI